jgi:hypothetical protein
MNALFGFGIVDDRGRSYGAETFPEQGKSAVCIPLKQLSEYSKP